MQQPTHDSNNDPVIEAQGVSRNFGDTRALNGVSIKVRKGELFGLVGPDGAGKTTLIRALSGLIGIHGGSVRVLGKDPLKNPTLRDAMGVMPQHYSLYGDLSVGENMRFFARLYCLSRKVYLERAERLLELTRLAPFIDRRAEALSGGMYKKLALACALLHEFVNSGMAVLISTAYMDEAARCNQVCLLHAGNVVAEGVPARLVRELENPVFEVKGGERDALHRMLADASGVVAASPAGERLRIVLEKEAVTRITSGIEQLGAHLSPVAADFEDVFLAYAYGADRDAHRSGAIGLEEAS